MCPKGYCAVVCLTCYFMYVSECPVGRFGSSCASACLCQNDAHCHFVTGECTCASGFRGIYCETPCNGSTWGVDCLEVRPFQIDFVVASFSRHVKRDTPTLRVYQLQDICWTCHIDHIPRNDYSPFRVAFYGNAWTDGSNSMCEQAHPSWWRNYFLLLKNSGRDGTWCDDVIFLLFKNSCHDVTRHDDIFFVAFKNSSHSVTWQDNVIVFAFKIKIFWSQCDKTWWRNFSFGWVKQIFN